MEELQVTRYWMLGVVTTMLIFGGIALIGYLRQRRARAAGAYQKS